MATVPAKELLERARQLAERSGAAEADVLLEVSNWTEVRVRQREIELVTQSAIQGLGLRVFADRRMASSYTTDLRPTVVDELVRRTIGLATQAASRDENKLPELLPRTQEELEIDDPALAAIKVDDLTALARSAEDSAFAQDRRIETTKDARCGASVTEVFFSNTYTPLQSYRATAVWLGVTAVATQGSIRREGTYVDRRRLFADLLKPEPVGETAAERALAKLGAVRGPSAAMPVIFESEAASGFLAGLFGAFSGQNVLEQRSYLAGRLGQSVASPLVTIVDDGTRRRGIGTRPFDGEGVQTRRTVVVERGVLRKFLQSAVTARRAGVPPTGNASRSYDSLPVVGPSNFYLEPGDMKPGNLIRDVARGLYVTGSAGFGFDTVGGEYSQQVEGRWIEKGALAAPAEGVTVAGKLDDMLLGIDGVANDIDFRTAVVSPTIRFRQLTVGGS
jgi:PmbA protein